MLPRLAALLLLLAGARGCLSYEFEHEFWLRVDGSGSVRVTGRPVLWAAFKNMSHHDADDASLREAARLLFEASGLQVRRVTVTRRGGQRYLFVAADFSDVNRLWDSPAFPDLRLHLVPQGERLRLSGRWTRPVDTPKIGPEAAEGMVATRFHLPSKVYQHQNAADGVERGNIVSWRQSTAEALAHRPLDFAVVMDSRSILWSTLSVFGAAIVVAILSIGAALWFVLRKGRRAAAA